MKQDGMRNEGIEQCVEGKEQWGAVGTRAAPLANGPAAASAEVVSAGTGAAPPAIGTMAATMANGMSAAPAVA